MLIFWTRVFIALKAVFHTVMLHAASCNFTGLISLAAPAAGAIFIQKHGASHNSIRKGKIIDFFRLNPFMIISIPRAFGRGTNSNESVSTFKFSCYNRLNYKASRHQYQMHPPFCCWCAGAPRFTKVGILLIRFTMWAFFLCPYHDFGLIYSLSHYLLTSLYPAIPANLCCTWCLFSQADKVYFNSPPLSIKQRP